MSHADEVWVGSGYFSSHCLAQVAPGLADFIERSEAPLRLLISPEISLEDRAAITKGVTTEQDFVDRLAEEIFEDGTLSESALVEHTSLLNLQCRGVKSPVRLNRARRVLGGRCKS